MGSSIVLSSYPQFFLLLLISRAVYRPVQSLDLFPLRVNGDWGSSPGISIHHVTGAISWCREREHISRKTSRRRVMLFLSSACVSTYKINQQSHRFTCYTKQNSPALQGSRYTKPSRRLFLRSNIRLSVVRGARNVPSPQVVRTWSLRPQWSLNAKFTRSSSPPYSRPSELVKVRGQFDEPPASVCAADGQVHERLVRLARLHIGGHFHLQLKQPQLTQPRAAFENGRSHSPRAAAQNGTAACLCVQYSMSPHPP